MSISIYHNIVTHVAERMHGRVHTLSGAVGYAHLIDLEKLGENIVHELIHRRIFDPVEPAVAEIAN